MNRTLKTEDVRKNKLFEAWIKYLTAVHEKFKLDNFEEIYEGIATVSEISKNRVGLHLRDERKLRHIPISTEIGNYSCRLDSMYVVLGLLEDRWHVIDVISIGSICGTQLNEVHLTFNPLYVGKSGLKEVVI